MAGRRPLDIADLSEIRFRLETVGIAARLAAVLFGAGAIYVLATWEEPNRTSLAALFGVLLVIGAGPMVLPLDRIVRSSLREVFFLGWSVVWIAATTAIVAVDGAADTPLAALFILPVVFAALSYPLLSVVVVGTLAELAFVAVSSASGEVEPSRSAWMATVLAGTVVLCAWQARNHDRRRCELESISRADALTGILNRRGFEERLTSELDDAIRHGQPLAVVMVDLDSFKEVNDTRGHAAGDELLRWTARIMQDTVRPVDAVGRLGGDEFAVLLRGAGAGDASDVAARLKRRLRERVVASVGTGVFPADGIEPEELLRRADSELYSAKAGRPDPARRAGRRELSWAAAMAQAVDLRMGEQRSARVSDQAAAIGRALGFTDARLALLRIAAMLHDVGKASLPDAVLRRPRRLNMDEEALVRAHPVVGAELIERVEGLEEIVPWIRHSHENFDGSGYPDGLRGEDIPIESRILHVADAFDAMTNGRPYQAAIGADEALAELRRCAGGQFDPACVDALAATIANGGALPPDPGAARIAPEPTA